MKKELRLAIIVLIAVIIGFTITVKLTEDINIKNIRSKYSYATNLTDNKDNIIKEPTEKAIEYGQKKVYLWITSIVLSIMIPGVFLISGLSSGIRNWVYSKNKRAFIAIALYFITYSIINFIIMFPIDYYKGFVLKHAYDLSNQSFNKWFLDIIKNFIVTTAAGALFIYIPYTLIKRSPRYWWVQFSLLLIPIIFFITFISPIYIDPIFNKYEEVQDKPLEQKIYKEINRTTIENCNVYQVNKSVDTKEMNAYMTGVLNTKRIVLWDTTIKNLSHDETLGIVAHEMGHYLMGHIWKSILLGGALSMFIFYAVNKSAHWIIDKSQGAFGFSKLQDIASLPLLILLFNIFMFAAAPAINGYSRHTELEADRFQLELTRNNNAAISSTIKLHESSFILPSPGIVYKLWNYDHPTFEERVEFANKYRPWKENKKIKYHKYIKY